MNARTQAVFDAAKAKPSCFDCVPASHLTQAERRELVAAGVSVTVDRMGKPFAYYSQANRVADLRARVQAKRKDETSPPI